MYKRRLIILLVFVAVMLTVTLGRLGYLQLVRGDDYRREAEISLQSVELLPGPRGRILDRNGVILAEDEPCYDLCLDYRLLVDDARWRSQEIRRIARTEGLNLKQEADRERAATMFDERVKYTWALARSVAGEQGIDLDEAAGEVRRTIDRQAEIVGGDIREQEMAHPIVHGLDEATGLALQDPMTQTVGAVLRPSHRRRYPSGDVACHIIGVTGPVFREDVERHNLTESQAPRLTRLRENYLPGDTIGKMGVERMMEKQLRAKRGYRRRAGDGSILEDVPATPGQDIRLSIDIRLQQVLTELMRGSGSTGAIVILDVPTGDVLAMVSWPTYDLNTYRRRYKALVDDELNLPLLHRAVAACYAPGSTVKPVVALAGLTSGKITPETMIECPGYVYMTPSGKKVIRDHAIGVMAVVEALERSSNAFLAKVGQRLGPRYLTAWLGRFGFGRKPGTGLPNERSGVLADEAWLLRNRGRRFLPSDCWFFSIGQGIFAASPLQVANAHATVARGGAVLLAARRPDRRADAGALRDHGPARRRRDRPGGDVPRDSRLARHGPQGLAGRRAARAGYVRQDRDGRGPADAGRQ